MISALLPSLFLLTGAEEIPWTSHEYVAAPLDNPLRGFVPYRGAYDFPHSMEYTYVGLADLVAAPGVQTFDGGLEPILNDVASRGHQTIFRIFLDYPDEATSVPQFLIDQGLTMTSYTDHGGGRSPDYAFPPLIEEIERTVTALGARYDGDPRIAYIQMGVLGHWGEWHTWPRTELFPPVAIQNRVIGAYGRAFSRTHVLISQDAMGGEPMPALTGTRLGFHDDDFANSTLPVEDWMFVARLRTHGFAGRWMQFPIGGEIQPDYQDSIWNVPSGAPQDFDTCVRETHATWLLNHGAFENRWPEPKRQRAREASRLLGYELHVPESRLIREGAGVRVQLRIENRGVAPFPYPWPCRLTVTNAAGTEVLAEQPTWDLRTVQSGQPAQTWEHVLPTAEGTIHLIIPNALPNGRTVGLANAMSVEGLVLGEVMSGL